MKLNHLPNIITGIRCALVIPIALALGEGRYFLALVLFIVAGITDGIDGFLAKRFNWQSKLGGVLDPIADKFLLVTTLVILSLNGVLPAWFVALAIIRDVLIVTGGTIYYFWVAKFTASPTYLSKLNTVMQIVVVFWVVMVQTWPHLDFGVSTLLINLTVITTVLSGIQYVGVWGYRAWRVKQNGVPYEHH